MDLVKAGDLAAVQKRLTSEPTEDFKFRASSSRAVRAPDIAELFSPQTASLIEIVGWRLAIAKQMTVKIIVRDATMMPQRRTASCEAAGARCDSIEM